MGGQLYWVCRSLWDLCEILYLEYIKITFEVKKEPEVEIGILTKTLNETHHLSTTIQTEDPICLYIEKYI